MLSRALCQAGQRLGRAPVNTILRHQPKRGKAISNWKRPSMEEYGVPTEPWEQVYARNNKRFNMQLAAGVVLLTGTLLFAKTSGLIFLNTTPYHLMTNKKD